MSALLQQAFRGNAAGSRIPQGGEGFDFQAHPIRFPPSFSPFIFTRAEGAFPVASRRAFC